MWRKIIDEEKTITCSKMNGGVVEYGILEETGIAKETIQIGNQKYDKAEVEQALKGVKSL